MRRLFILIAIFFSTATFGQIQNYSNLVDTRIGTQGHGLGCGFTYVAATYPFGMLQLGPAFFTPQRGIVVNQLSGAGCPNMGNFPALPLVGRLKRSPNDMNGFPSYASTTNTSAGQLGVAMADGITYEATVSKRSGVVKFNFPDSENESTILIGSGINATTVDRSMVKITSKSSCEGFADGGDFCGSPTRYVVYFAAEFNKGAELSGTWIGDDMRDGRDIVGGSNSGAYFTFDTSDGKAVEYKIAISYVSIENAKQNLLEDNNNRNFEQVRDAATDEWNRYLGVIDVNDDDDDRKVQFYTGLYHSLIHPNVTSDINGEYIGADNQIYQLTDGEDIYSTWSGWDTYRTQCQLLAMLFPTKASEMMNSLVKFADQSGGFGRWVLANIETGIMHGDPISLILSNSYAFGAENFDLNGAYGHMLNSATVPGIMSQNVTVRPGLESYIENGFDNASLSLEYASADHAIGKFAKEAIDNNEDGEFFVHRAKSWRNLYDPSTNWLRSRHSHNKEWKDPDHDWRESTKENYFWMVPHDLLTLIDTMGGNRAATDRLDELFVRLDATYDDHHFASGNEPSFQIPWVYNWTDQPYKCSNVIQRILSEQYSSKPTGLPGNDDCGAMGAWYVFASMGLYPVVPGEPLLSVNLPQFKLITITLESGEKIVISGGAKSGYIHSMKLNGKNHNDSPTVEWSALENGASITYTTSSKPNRKWGL